MGMFELRYQTPPEWVSTALSDFDAFLMDHASCERKASAVGMSFVVRYPDRQAILEPMINFAREELEHFHQVYRLIAARGLSLQSDEPDAYVNLLMDCVRFGREERFLDRLLVSSVIEARGHERIMLVANHLTDPDLKNLYTRLGRAEGTHKTLFVELAELYFPIPIIKTRLSQLLDFEAEAIQKVPHRSALH